MELFSSISSIKSLIIHLFLLGGLLLFQNTCYAYDDIHVSWKELESEHFVIHFPETREFFARRALNIAEEAHAQLSLLLANTPKEKTHISVTDNLDEANGWARTLPLNEIQLYAYPPALSEELGLYDDWMRQLIYHEYTHILHMDTAHGLHNFINIIFGKTARNNATAPRWYTEGLAVYYETLLSNSGRLRNALYRTMLRNAALAQKIPSLGQLSAGSRRWPADSGYYLFGSFFLAYIAEHYGSETLTQWNHEYGDDWIPYAMNRAALRVWGKTWDDLYDEWITSVMREAELSTSPDETPHRSLMEPWRHSTPQVLPNGHRISYLRSDGTRPRTLVERDLDTGQETEITECWGSCKHRWNADASRLYFAHSQTRDGYLQRNTLYVYERENDRIRALPVPDRVRSFDLEGDDLYLVIQENEACILYRYGTQSETLIELYRS